MELEAYQISVDNLYNELSSAFSGKYEEWGIRVLDDLTIKFENTDIIFDRDSVVIKKEFRNILDEFIPKYFNILNKIKYSGRIKEIKVEGHTAAKSPIHNTYIKTVQLSQGRARAILEYIRNGEYFQGLNTTYKNKITFWLSANGFGYSRALDDSNKFVYHTGNKISPNSRRVEFKIVTNSDELVENLIKRK